MTSMKRYSFLVMLLTGSLVSAQNVDFAPVGARWWINQIVEGPFSVPADSFVIAEVTHEEMKAGELCRVITGLSGCGLPNPAHVFTRHDSVFFFSEVTDQFELLYDFTATVGSTWTVKGLSHAPLGDLVVNITEVREIEMFGRVYKAWFMPFTEQWGDRIVEKAGSLWYPGPTPPWHCLGGIEDYAPYSVRCYEENGELYTFTTTGCDWYDDISGTYDLEFLQKMIVTPNPAYGVMRLQIPGMAFDEGQIMASVYSPDGVVLHSRAVHHTDSTIDISGYPAGIYYLVLQKNGKPVDVHKVVVGQ